MAILINAPNNAGCILHLPLDENGGSVARDHSGNGNNGSLINSPQWVDGILGKALSFNGNVSQFVNLGTSLSSLQVPMTITGWFFQISSSLNARAQTIISQYSSTSNHRLVKIVRIDNGTFKYYTSTDAGGFQSFGTKRPSLNTWHFFAVNISGSVASPSVTITIDNVSESSSLSALSSTPDTTVDVRIGDAVADYPSPAVEIFNGLIDDIRIYNRSLSQQEITTLYNSGATKIIAPSNQGLVGAWNFDEGSGKVLFDSSGKNGSGTIVNTANWVNGIHGKALRFDGTTNTLVTLPSVSIPNEITVSMWVWSNNYNQNGMLITKEPVNTNWTFFFESTSLRWRGGGNTSMSINQLTNNQWHHLVVTQTGTTATIFVNGVFANTGTVQALANGSGVINVGWYNSSYFFNGIIDSLRLYGRALSQSEISTLYNSGSTKLRAADNSGIIAKYEFNEGAGGTLHDSSGNNLHGNLINSPSWVDGKFGKALSFNGTNQEVRMINSSDFNLLPVTVCCWAKFNSIIPNCGLVNKYVSSSLNGYQLFLNGNNLTGWYYQGANFVAVSTNAPPPLNKWSFYVFVVDSTSAQLYVNGALVSSGSWTGAVTTTTDPLKIGKYSSFYYDGQIDDVRIYSKALSSQQVLDLYNSY